MKLALFDANGADHIGIVCGDSLLDFSHALQAFLLIEEERVTEPVTDMVTLMRAGMFNRQTFASVLDWVDQHSLSESFQVDQPQLRAPIRRPGKIVALVGNYHTPDEDPPQEPIFFFKVNSSIIGPGEPIVQKASLKQVDPEIELAVIIGKEARSVRREDAAEVIAGYSILNDVTARDLQAAAWGSLPWEYTKSIDTFTPFGPYLVLADGEFDPTQALMTLKVNGECVAECSTGQMIFDVPRLIEHISAYLTLEPGDVIATGTPDHPRMQPGDTVELTILGIGSLSNPLVAEAL